MAYWVCVAGSRETVDRLQAESETWWCVPKDAGPGDQLAMYVARHNLKDLPEDQGGVTAIFEITGPDPERETDCRRFGHGVGGRYLAPVKIVVKERFAVSLKFADMKRDKRLATAQFVRRSFQGTCFPATPLEFRRILGMLSNRQESGREIP